MPIQGLRDTSGFVTDQRPKNWRETIMLLYPNGKAPLTALTTLMRSDSTDDPEFNWWEKRFPNQRLALSAAIDTTQTTIPVSSGAKGFREGHLMLIEQTNEIVLVVADPNDDTNLVVQRGFSGTVATAIANIAAAGVNPNIRCVGNAKEEGSQAPTGVNYDPSKVFNYTQIFRNTLEMTRTASKTRLRTGNQVKEAKRECLELHSIEIEKAFFWGKKLETTYKGKPLRTTGGFLSFIDPNNVVANNGADINMETLEGWLERMFRYGSSEKMAFAGNIALLAVQQIVRKNSAIQIQSGIKEFGMNVTRLTCPFGELTMKTHPLFNQINGGTTGGTAYYGMDSSLVVMDQQELKYRPFTDADTKYQPDLQSNGLDGMQSGYLTEAGLEVHFPEAHFWIKGLTHGIKDA